MQTEYLERPLIEDVSYEITETRVIIECPHTCFVSRTLADRCRKDALLDQYRRVLRMAKEQGAKISYSRHIRKTIREQWPGYVAGREKQERLFQELRSAAEAVRQRGIHLGHADDEALARIYGIRNALEEISLRDEAMRGITGAGQYLWTLEQELSRRHERYDMITL